MKELEQLRQFLNRSLRSGQPWPVSPEQATQQQRLAAVRQHLAPPRGRHALPRIAQGVLAFRLQRRATPYPDLKYACYGLARPTDWEGRLLLDDERLCADLLAAVAALRPQQPADFAACWRALQRAWTTDIATGSDTLSPAGRRNAAQVAAFLEQNRPTG